MNWSTWLGGLRPAAFRKRKRSRSATNAVPVPRLSRNRVNSKLPRFSGGAAEPDTTNVDLPNASKVSRLRQAFTPSQPIADLRRFAGRAELLERLIRAIEDRRMHVVLYGDRGIGKTSLLHILAILAREARYLVRYVSCSEDSEFDEVFRTVAADIPLLYHREYDPTSFEAESGHSLADALGTRPLTASTLSESFAKVAGTRILVILDEFDRATSPAFRKSVAELIKNLSDRSARVQIVIGGVAGNLAELIEHIPSIRRNVLGMPVGRMSEDELREIIANGEAIGQILFEAHASRDLLALGNGSPYLVNVFGLLGGAIAIARQSSYISAADVETAAGEVEGELRSRLGPAAHKQLFALENGMPAEQLRTIGRQAQHHFGELLPDQNKAIIAAVKSYDEAGWLSEAGEFRFCDDSIPIILSLAQPRGG